MNNKRTVYKSKYRDKEKCDAHLFAGRLKCLDCDSSMHKGTPCRDGNTYHIRCKLSNKTRSRECTPHTIKLSTLTARVAQRIREIINGYMTNEGNVNFMAEALNNKAALKKKIAGKERELGTLGGKILEENSCLTATHKDKVKGLLSDEQFMDLRATLQTEVEKYKNRKSRLEEEISSLKFKINSTGDIEATVKKYANFEKLTHEIVNEFIDYIEIGERTPDKEQEIVIHWLF